MPDKLTPLQKVELEELNELMDVLGLDNAGHDFETGDYPEDAKKRFRVRDLDTLNWAFRKVAALTAVKESIDQVKKNEVARIENWYASEIKKTVDNISFFNFIIEEYVRERQLNDEKYKGDSTPYGKVSFKKQQDEWTYTDESKAIEALEANGFAESHIKTEKKISSKSEVKKVFEVKKNVFVSAGGRFLEAATGFNEDSGYKLAEGLQYKCAVLGDEGAELGIIVDIATGEEVQDVFFLEIGVFLNNYQVEGVEVSERPSQVVIKPEVHS